MEKENNIKMISYSMKIHEIAYNRNRGTYTPIRTALTNSANNLKSLAELSFR